MTKPIVKTIAVNCSAAEAFDVFVDKIADWWPLDGHSASASQGGAAHSVTLERRVGGAFYETMHDGGRDDWGKVLIWEEGRRFVTSWHPGNNKDNPTQLEVEFADNENGTSAVTLTHSGWEAWGDRADEMRAAYDSGWDFVFGARYLGGCG